MKRNLEGEARLRVGGILLGYFNPALGIFLGNQSDGFVGNDGFIFWPINVPFLQK